MHVLLDEQLPRHLAREVAGHELFSSRFDLHGSTDTDCPTTFNILLTPRTICADSPLGSKGSSLTQSIDNCSTSPMWRHEIDEIHDAPEPKVTILAIGIKEKDRVRIGGETIKL